MRCVRVCEVMFFDKFCVGNKPVTPTHRRKYRTDPIEVSTQYAAHDSVISRNCAFLPFKKGS